VKKEMNRRDEKEFGVCKRNLNGKEAQVWWRRDKGEGETIGSVERRSLSRLLHGDSLVD
jgi:hypothetical protein